MKSSSQKLPEYQLDFSLCVENATIRKALFIKIFERGIAILKKKPHLKTKMKGGRIELALVDDETIRAINKLHRGKNTPTDVVSLSYFETEKLKPDFPTKLPASLDESENNLLGEIIISVPTAKRQAREHQKTLNEELQFLFAHGLLHIFGYDHEEAIERKVMFDLQDEILGSKKWRKAAEQPFEK